MTTNRTLAVQPSPNRAADMLSHMSYENMDTIYRLIVTVYNSDVEAMQYEKKKREEKMAAFANLEKIRKQYGLSFHTDFDPEEAIMTGLTEKYGSFN